MDSAVHHRQYKLIKEEFCIRMKVWNYILEGCYLRLSTRSSCKDFPIPKARWESLKGLRLKSDSHPAIYKCVKLYGRLTLINKNTKYKDKKLTWLSERSRMDMVEERLRRIRKRAFAKLRPRLLSENCNEHNDLTVTEALKKITRGKNFLSFYNHIQILCSET